MPPINAYLFFDGTCADAMHFYERTFDGKLDLMTQADSPEADRTPAGAADNRILHARLVFDGGTLMASDWMADQPYERMQGFSLSLGYETFAEAKRIFEVLAEGGKVRMTFQQTFWASGFGMLDDRFGTPWMVSGPPASA
jgi:PhnB protein